MWRLQQSQGQQGTGVPYRQTQRERNRAALSRRSRLIVFAVPISQIGTSTGVTNSRTHRFPEYHDPVPIRALAYVCHVILTFRFRLGMPVSGIRRQSYLKGVHASPAGAPSGGHVLSWGAYTYNPFRRRSRRAHITYWNSTTSCNT